VIEIRENYRAFLPPPWFRPTVERLLKSLRTEQLGGLQSIILTDSASIGRGKTRRVGGKKFHRNECRGFYHRQWRGRPAWIQLVTDDIIKGSGYPTSLLHFQLFRDLAVAEPLYHEIGHHLHETVGSTTPGGEEAAEYWRKRLSKSYGRSRYWYVRPIFAALRPIIRLFRHTDGYQRYARAGRAG
jgi:hypothetical protein